MTNYWTKNRLLFDIIVPIILILIVAFAFVSPVFANEGEIALMQSLSKSKKLDFDVPSPSFEQISQLERETTIKSVFPYYFTRASVFVNGKIRETRLFFSDAFDKLDQTMYCDERLIEKASENYNNPIYVDYKFVSDTNAKLGSVVSVTLGTKKVDFQVAAIYETNTYYDGGAVIAKWEGSQKEAVMVVSPKLAYSGAYIQAADHAQCKNYLEANYKPYGRLKDRSEFSSQEAYETHYNAFMSANYSNEITDFAVKTESTQATVSEKSSSTTISIILCGIVLVVAMVFVNFLLWIRKSEKGYMEKRQVKGGKIGVYYVLSTLVQSVILLAGMSIAVIVASLGTQLYIPDSVVVEKTIAFGCTALVAVVALIVENSILAHKIGK